MLVVLVVLFSGLLMAPNRRQFDHIGNFNFKVEIEGANAGAFGGVTVGTLEDDADIRLPASTLAAELERARCEGPCTIELCVGYADPEVEHACWREMVLEPLEDSIDEAKPLARLRLIAAYDALAAAITNPESQVVLVATWKQPFVLDGAVLGMR